jgi:hypothetical protein
MNKKRYDKKVDITIRVPVRLRDRLRALVRKIEDARIEVPEHDAPVKPSIAALALRGLEMELDLYNSAEAVGRDARAEVRRRGLNPTAGAPTIPERILDEWEARRRRAREVQS